MPDERPRCQRDGCSRLIPDLRVRRRAKYCTPSCKDKAIKARIAERKRAERDAAVTEQDYAAINGRKGETFDRIAELLAGDRWDDWLAGRILNSEIARTLKVSESAVYRAKVTALAERHIHDESVGWQPDPAHTAMLGPPDDEMRALVEGAQWEEFERDLDIAIAGFKDFRDAFFEYMPNRPFFTKPYHLKWMREVLRTIYTGGRTMILSPPRHGKSELLVHFSVWLILRNPDIRILWIGPNDDIAQNMLGSVRDILAEQGEVRVSCEFCRQAYVYDAVDVERLFAAVSHPDVPSTRH